jgi:hypothetical protein
MSSIQAYLGYCVTPSNYRLLPQDTSLIEHVEHPSLPGVLWHFTKLQTLPQDTSLRERVKHPGLPGILRHSVKLQTSTPGYIADRACRASRPTWGIVTLRQTKDFTPGYIAERACQASRPTWGIASLHQTTDFYPRIHRLHNVQSKRGWWRCQPWSMKYLKLWNRPNPRLVSGSQWSCLKTELIWLKQECEIGNPCFALVVSNNGN